MRIVKVKELRPRDYKRGIRIGQIGAVVDLIENGALLVKIADVGMVMLFTEQIEDVKDA